MRTVLDLSAYPLCDYFLSRYVSARDDPDNFPSDQFPGVFQRYENIFGSARQVLDLTREALKSRSEFNFDSGNAANLESGIAVLRVIEALRLANFRKIALVLPEKDAPSADITCEKNGHKICCETKAITKQSSGRSGRFMADQLYEKVRENIPKARKQLVASARELQCEIRIFVSVINWFAQSVYLNQSDYQHIVDRLERDHGSLKGIDGVWFITRAGQQFGFLNPQAKCIDDEE